MENTKSKENKTITVVRDGRWDFAELDKLVSEGWRVERMEPVEMGKEMLYRLYREAN